MPRILKNAATRGVAGNGGELCPSACPMVDGEIEPSSGGDGMGVWHAVLAVLFIVGGLAALHRLHRFCLWLEDHGWLYYKHKKPSSSAASCFVALQQVVEPRQHFVQVQEEKRHHAEEEAPGKGE
jgi:hypothetical protein